MDRLDRQIKSISLAIDEAARINYRVGRVLAAVYRAVTFSILEWPIDSILPFAKVEV